MREVEEARNRDKLDERVSVSLLTEREIVSVRDAEYDRHGDTDKEYV